MAAQARKYAIRAPLNMSRLDMVINPSTKDIQFEHEITLRTLFIALGSAIIWWVVIDNTWMRHGGVFVDVFFSIAYFCFTLLIAAPTPTKENGYDLLGPLEHYFLDDLRRIPTHPNSPAQLAGTLINIRGVIKNNVQTNSPLIVFNNGDVGEMIEVMGNASIMTFDNDRQRIVNAADAFYKHLHSNVSFTLDSVSSAQRVTEQLNSKDEQAKLMKVHDMRLMGLQHFNKYIIKYYVGKKFKAWHQYLTVRGVNSQAIRDVYQWLVSNVRDTGLYCSEIRTLSIDEIMAYLKDIYGDDVSQIKIYDDDEDTENVSSKNKEA